MRISEIRGGRRAALVAAALGMACAPVAVRAQALFTDDFNADTTSHYDVYSFDQAVSSSAVISGTGGNDVTITPAFNYSQYTYAHLSDNEIDTVYDPIPVAPRTTDGSTVGLRLDVNNAGSTSSSSGGRAIINLLPKMAQYAGGALPSGNYKVTVDVWVNYNGGPLGGVGSTEYALLGLNQNVVGTGLAGMVYTNPTVQQKGQGIAIDGETGSTIDYRLFTDNSRLGEYNSSSGYVAPVDGDNSAADGQDNSWYWDRFPSPTFESKGGIGKHWVTLEAKYVDGVVYYSIDAHTGNGMQLIAAHTDLTSTSGNVALGYADVNGGAADKESSGPFASNPVDANFVIYDNLSIDQLPASAARPTWNAANGSWNGPGNWLNGTPNSSTAFAAFGAAAAGKTVTVDAPVSVQEIDFDNAGMTIGGSGTLTMDSPGTTGGVMGTFNVKQGAQVVSAPVAVNKNLLFNVAQAGSSLTFTQPLGDSSYEFTKTGDGDVNLRGGRNGGLVVLGGKVNLVPGSGTMVTKSILIVGSISNQRGSVDLNDNKLVLDYDGDLGSATDNIRSTISGAFGSGNWAGKGITSSLAVNDPQKIKGIGYWEASDLLGLSGAQTATWFGQTVDATSLLMAVTYIGDLNFDGKVDGDDFALIDRAKLLYGVSTSTDPRGIAADEAQWVNGDVNYDGVIDANDYALIDKTYGILHGGLSPDFLAMREAEFGSDYVTSLVASVPEPGTIGLAAVAIGASIAGRRRRTV